jgi:hypothetical protein
MNEAVANQHFQDLQELQEVQTHAVLLCQPCRPSSRLLASFTGSRSRHAQGCITRM